MADLERRVRVYQDSNDSKTVCVICVLNPTLTDDRAQLKDGSAYNGSYFVPCVRTSDFSTCLRN